MTTKRVARGGILAAILVVSQVSLAPLPNVELVSLLIYLYAITIPLSDTIMVVVIFSTVEMVLWGVGEWVIGYYWVWSLWAVIAYYSHKLIKGNTYLIAILHCVWGLSFGLLFAINYGIFYGTNYTIAYWIRGIPFDVTHAIANYIIAMTIAPILTKAIERIGAKNERPN